MKSTLFGINIEPDFDVQKERRNDRVGWALHTAVIMCGIYLFGGGHFATQVFQGTVATILCYGANFYTEHRQDLKKPWFWKAVIATIPMHLGYIALLLWSDKVAPQAMTRAMVFMPALLVGFALETLVILNVIAYFTPAP